MNRPLRLVSLVALGLAIAPHATAWTATSPAQSAPAATTIDAVQRLTLQVDAAQRVYVDGVVVRGRSYELDLQARSMRAPEFRVVVVDGDREREIEPPPSRTYRGVLRAVDGHEYPAAGSLDSAQRLTAFVLIDGEGFSIAPDPMHGPDDYRVHSADDVLAELPFRPTCATLDPVDPNYVAPSRAGIEPGLIIRTCRIALDSDFELFDKYANPSGFSPPDCTAFAGPVECMVNGMESVMAGVAVIYETYVAVTYEITTIIVRQTAGAPYTSTNPNTLLDQFHDHWLATKGAVDRNVAHLFTGKELGVPIGIAYLQGVCNPLSNGFGLSQTLHYTLPSQFGLRVALTAHEIGHNWNAIHCDAQPLCAIMCSGIGGCTAHITEFEQFTIDRIVAWRDSHLACLPAYTGEVALEPFFSDRFITTNLDTIRWNYFKGAALTTTAVNTPDFGPSLRLRADGNGDFQDHEIRTNELDLANAPGAANFRISYYTEHRGVESGEQLVVEYYASDLNWHELNRSTSDGVDQTAFVFSSHAMPADALHEKFRLRFRAEVGDVGAQNDDWFVDMVRIGKGPTSSTLLATPRLTLENPFPPLLPGAVSITSAGDRNGDGRDDFLVGYPQQNRAFVFSGLDGTMLTDIDAGPPTGQLWGASVASLTVGGGCKDHLLGGPGTAATIGGVRRACASSVFGSFNGDQFGWSVAALSADLDADGVKDFVVGAPAMFGGIGYVRVLSGADNSTIFQFNGSFAGEGFGFSVDGVDDTNGDGVIDILVGIPFSGLGEAGSVRVYSGSNGALLRTETSIIPGQQMGFSVSGLGDMNGDARSEFIAGAPGRVTSMGIKSGAVYVFNGQTAGAVVYELLGSFDRDHFGWSVDGIRDMNHDNKAEIFVGAPAGDPTSGMAGFGPGTAHIYSGANGNELWDFRGEGLGEFFGAAVAYGGRVKSKGDLQVMAAAIEHGAGQTARTYVFTIPLSNPNLQNGGL